MMQHGHLPLHGAIQVPHNMPLHKATSTGAQPGYLHKDTPTTVAWVPSPRRHLLLQHEYLLLHEAPIHEARLKGGTTWVLSQR